MEKTKHIRYCSKDPSDEFLKYVCLFEVARSANVLNAIMEKSH